MPRRNKRYEKMSQAERQFWINHDRETSRVRGKGKRKDRGGKRAAAKEAIQP